MDAVTLVPESGPSYSLYLAAFRDPDIVGHLPYALTDWREISGLAQSQRTPTILWAQADGNISKLLAINTADASVNGEWTLTGQTGTDYEDLASATVNGQPYLYLADTGDNGNARANLAIVRIKEPPPSGANGVISAGDIERITCVFPAGNTPSHKDAETLLVDPTNGDMYLVTKRVTPAKLYRLAHAASYTGTQTLEYLGDIWAGLPNSVPYDNANGGYCVGGAISPSGREIVLKNYDLIYHFPRAANQTILAALQLAGTPLYAYCRGGRPSSHWSNEPQGEAITFDAIGEHMFTASEAGDGTKTGAAADNYPLRRYRRLPTIPGETTLQQPASGPKICHDTYIQITTPTTPHGTETTWVVDLDAADERYGLLKFDLATIPTAAIVVGADLELYIGTEGQDFDIYECLTIWDEATTYSTFNNGAGVLLNDVVVAATPCVRHGSPATAAANHGYDAITGWTKSKIPVDIVQRWINGSRPNNGFILRNSGNSLDGLQFRSAETTTVTDRPLLRLRYLIPPEPAAPPPAPIAADNGEPVLDDSGEPITLD